MFHQFDLSLFIYLVYREQILLFRFDLLTGHFYQPEDTCGYALRVWHFSGHIRHALGLLMWRSWLQMPAVTLLWNLKKVTERSN